MRELNRLLFSQVMDAYPERWEKARPGNCFVNRDDDKPGSYLVRRQGGEWHECQLVENGSHFFGHCDCDRHKYNQDACSHLCAVFRLFDRDEFVSRPAEKISVELQSQQQQLADAELHSKQGSIAGGLSDD